MLKEKVLENENTVRKFAELYSCKFRWKKKEIRYISISINIAYYLPYNESSEFRN